MRKRIRKLYASAKKPLRRLRHWARQPKGKKGRHKRWSALANFAKSRIKLARKKGNPKRLKLWVAQRKHYRKKKRYLKKQIDRAAERKAKESASGIVTLDGKPVTADWARVLVTCRATGIWKGYLLSGWRSPAYSEGLCIQICGAPQCPGRCAGRASNHSQNSIPEGAAVDVTDHVNFRRALIVIGRPELHNAIGSSDPNHFSITGR